MSIDVKPSVNRSDVYASVWPENEIILLFPDSQRHKILVVLWVGWTSDLVLFRNGKGKQDQVVSK